MIALLALMPAASAQVTRTVNVCVDYDVSFSDAVNAPGVDGIGDFWDNNTVHRAGIGLAYEITTNAGIYSGNLDTAGCVTRNVQFVASGANTFDFTISSSTRRRGVDILFRFNTSPDGSGLYHWQDATTQHKVWQGLAVPDKGSASHTVIIPAIDGWQILAVATWLIHRSDWKLFHPVDRSCCLGDAAALDGTCGDTGTHGYKRETDPYSPSQPKILVHGIWDLGSNNPDDAGCCSSRLRWDQAPVGAGGFVVGFEGGVDEQRRYTLAHELGHVLVGVRMGGREDGYPGNAPLDDCNGTYTFLGMDHHHVPTFTLMDTGGLVRGTITKEYNSQSAREGWADWVSAWAWNSVNHADCEFKHWSYQDFDLDGDIDNWFGEHHHWNGTWDCLGTPELFVADPADPTGAFIGATNWLGDVLDEEVCDPFTGTECLIWRRPIMESRNRSTVYDWHRMLYQLYKVKGLSPTQLSDLHVDMCPRKWRTDDSSCLDDDDLPLSRWEISAVHHGLSSAVFDLLDRVEH